MLYLSKSASDDAAEPVRLDEIDDEPMLKVDDSGGLAMAVRQLFMINHLR